MSSVDQLYPTGLSAVTQQTTFFCFVCFFEAWASVCDYARVCHKASDCHSPVIIWGVGFRWAAPHTSESCSDVMKQWRSRFLFFSQIVLSPLFVSLHTPRRPFSVCKWAYRFSPQPAPHPHTVWHQLQGEFVIVCRSQHVCLLSQHEDQRRKGSIHTQVVWKADWLLRVSLIISLVRFRHTDLTLSPAHFTSMLFKAWRRASSSGHPSKAS